MHHPVRQLLLCIAFTVLGACSSESSPAASTGKRTVAVIPKGTTHEFWKSIHAGAVQAAQELSVDIIWKGALREDSREDQIKIVEDFISRGVSGIVLSPLDDMALRLPVATATRSGIPVVIFDSGLKSDEYVSFVATDNYQAGVLAAEHIISVLHGSGRVVMLRYLEGSNSTVDREQAFLDVMKKHPGIELVSVNQYAGATTEGAYRAAENILLPLKNADGTLAIDAIFTACEPTTFGMLRALDDQGLAGKVMFLGFDSTPKLAEALKQGKITALVMQDPVKIGYLAVKSLISHLDGKPVEKRIDTGATLVTRENMADPEIQKLLAPDLKRWLGE